MTKRLFVAINLSEQTKKGLSIFQDRSVQNEIKWAKPEGFHFTVNFLGETDINNLPQITNGLRAITEDFHRFELEFQELIFAPPNKAKPTMIWAVFKSNDAYKSLTTLLNEKMLSIVSSYSSGRKDQTPHITLARFKGGDADNKKDLIRPKAGFSSITVTSIDLMESELHSNGPIYTVLESFQFS